MAFLRRWKLFAVQVGANVVGQLTASDVDPAVVEQLDKGAGEITPTHSAVVGASPVVTFSSTDIKGMLDLAGVAGLLIKIPATSTVLKLWFKERELGGTFLSGPGKAAVVTINNGMIYPVTVSAPHQTPPASIAYMIDATYDGMNRPLALTIDVDPDGVTLPAPQYWTLGPGFINGVLFESQSALELGFGISTAKDGLSSDVYPGFVGLDDRRPSMTWPTLDMAQIAQATGLGDVGIKRTGITRAFLRKMDDGGVPKIDTVAEHIRFEFAAGRIGLGRIAHGEPHASTGVQITPTGPDATIMVVNTAIAINVTP